MNIHHRLTGAALVVLLGAVSLAGCAWGGEPDADKGQDTTSQQQETDASQPGDDGAAPESPSGDKPNRAQVAEGFRGISAEALGGELPEEYIAEVADCFVDEAYDSMSAKTLNAIAEGKLWEIDEADYPLFGAAAEECEKLVTE